MLLGLTYTWMYVNRGDWGVMTVKLALDKVLGSHVALVDAEVLRTNVECFLLAFCEVQAVCINWLSRFTSTYRCLSHGYRVILLFFVGNNLLWSVKSLVVSWIREYFWLPRAHLSIVANTDDVMSVLVSDHREGVDWILMTISGEATLLDGL